VPGDEVIVPAYTWVATWMAVTKTGARPVAVNVDETTYNLDPDLIEAAITDRTAAIVPAHLRGEPSEMAAIEIVAAAAGLLVVEDAAQAHGARYRGRRVGSLGHAGAFSFYRRTGVQARRALSGRLFEFVEGGGDVLCAFHRHHAVAFRF
jgi:dTDP-3-amino-3,4,6-trideoxy-alpha-D-glucose transaminase